MIQFNVDVPMDQIEAFCRRWNVSELALFGSVTRNELRPDSDVDVLISFEIGAPWSYWNWPEMQDELKAIFGREIDLVVKDALRNPFRRSEILKTQQVLYAA